MAQVTIANVGSLEGKEATVRGWLVNKRSSGSIHFLTIRDGTGVMQAVAEKTVVGDEVMDRCVRLTQETSLSVTGLVRADRRAPGGYELSVRGLEIVGPSDDFPITPKEHGVDFLMDHRHLWLRSPRQNAVLRVRARVIKACRDFLDSEGFMLVDAPILTPSACEGTTTLFETTYFDSRAYLTQSGQLYNEAAAMAFGRVYCFGPTFRAEKSKTRRHLMEFWMLEPEAAFLELDGLMDLEERMISCVVSAVLDDCARQLAILERDVAPLRKVVPPFPRVSYDDALELLRQKGVSVEWGSDFGGGDETVLSQLFDRPVFVHRYPAACKAFYMKPDAARPELALCVDMLAPEGYGEVTGGGQRIDELALLERRLEEHGLPRPAYEWYLDLRRYGSVPHSGFGLGVERTVAWICGLDHVRETIPFPRMLYRMYP